MMPVKAAVVVDLSANTHMVCRKRRAKTQIISKKTEVKSLERNARRTQQPKEQMYSREDAEGVEPSGCKARLFCQFLRYVGLVEAELDAPKTRPILPE
jgi:hypothetical protein